MKDKIIKLLDEEIRQLIAEQSLGDTISKNLTKLKDKSRNLSDKEMRDRLKQFQKGFTSHADMQKNVYKIVADYYNKITDAGSRVLAGETDFIGGEMSIAPKIFNNNINDIKDDFSFRVLSFAIFLGEQNQVNPMSTGSPEYSQEVELKINKLARSFQAVGAEKPYNPYTASLAKSKTSISRALRKTRRFILSDLKLGASLRWKSILEEINIEKTFDNIIDNDIRLSPELLKEYVIPIFLFGQPFSNIFSMSKRRRSIDNFGPKAAPRVVPNLEFIEKIKKSKFFGPGGRGGGDKFTNSIILQAKSDESKIQNLQGFLSTMGTIIAETGVFLVPGGGYIVAAYEAIGLVWLAASLLGSFVLDYQFSKKIDNILKNCKLIFDDNGLLHETLKTYSVNVLPTNDITLADTVKTFVSMREEDGGYGFDYIPSITNELNNSNIFIDYQNSILEFQKALQILSTKIIEASKDSGNEVEEIKTLVDDVLFGLSSGVGLDNDLIEKIIFDLAISEKIKKENNPCHSWEQIKKSFIKLEKVIKSTGAKVKTGEVQEIKIQNIIDAEIKKLLQEQDGDTIVFDESIPVILNTDGTIPGPRIVDILSKRQVNDVAGAPLSSDRREILPSEYKKELMPKIEEESTRYNNFLTSRKTEAPSNPYKFETEQYEQFFSMTRTAETVSANAAEYIRALSVEFWNSVGVPNPEEANKERQEAVSALIKKIHKEQYARYRKQFLILIKTNESVVGPENKSFPLKYEEDRKKEENKREETSYIETDDYDYQEIKSNIEKDLISAENKLKSAQNAKSKEELESVIENLEEVEEKIDKTTKEIDEKLKDKNLSKDAAKDLKENKQELLNIKKDIRDAIKSSKGKISELPNDPTVGPEEEENNNTNIEIPDDEKTTPHGDPNPIPGETEGGTGIPGGTGTDPENDPNAGKFCYNKGIFSVAKYGKAELRTGKIGQSKLYASSKTTVDLIREFNEIIYRVTKSASRKWYTDSDDEKANIYGTISVHALEGFGPRVMNAAAPLFSRLGKSGIISFKEYFPEESDDPRYAGDLEDPERDISFLQQFLFIPGLLYDEGGEILDDENSASFYNNFISPIINALSVTLNSSECIIVDPKDPTKPRVFPTRRGGRTAKFKDLKFDVKTESPGPVFADALAKVNVNASSSTPLRDAIVFLISLDYLLEIIRTGNYSVLSLGT